MTIKSIMIKKEHFVGNKLKEVNLHYLDVEGKTSQTRYNKVTKWCVDNTSINEERFLKETIIYTVVGEMGSDHRRGILKPEGVYGHI